MSGRLPTRHPAVRHAAASLALAAASLVLLLLSAGCAGGEQDAPASVPAGHPPAANEVRLMISRDFGATVLLDVTAAADDGTSVLRLLAENSDVETAYGGGFVKSIDGLASTYGAVGDAEAQDWFYWVDGIMADVGAGDYDLQGGQTAWWDYHAWSQAMYLPAAVFALPSPWAGQTTTLHTNVEDAEVRSWAKSQGIAFSATEKLGEDPPASGVVVATAAEAKATPWLARRLAGEDGGVALVRLAGGRLILRALDGSSGPAASGVCVALPNPDDGDAPLLLLLVTDREALEPLLAAVQPESVRARVGVALVGGRPTLLPWRAE